MNGKQEELLRKVIREGIIREMNVMKLYKQAQAMFHSIKSGAMGKAEADESNDDIIDEDDEELNEEIGRNYHTLDTDPHNWKDVDGVDVTTYASTDGSWKAKVECEQMPEFDTPLRIFQNEEEAEHWARMQADRIILNLMNNKK